MQNGHTMYAMNTKKHMFGVWGVTPHISLEKKRLVRVFARWSWNIVARVNHFTLN